MADKLSKLLQQEQDATEAIKAIEAETKKRLRAAADAKRKVKEAIWMAAGELLEKAGLLHYLNNGDLGVLSRGVALVEIIEAAGLGEMPLEELRQHLEVIGQAEAELRAIAAPMEDAEETAKETEPVGTAGRVKMPWEGR